MNNFILLLLLAISSKNTAENTVYNAVFKAEPGWDIYLAGTYRYGPSIIENEDETIDAWFAAAGEEFGEKILYFSKDGASSPVSLSAGYTAAQKFTAENSFYSIDVACPSWGSSNSSLTINLYKWQTDYNTTTASVAIASKVYSNYSDNQRLQLELDDKFAAGEYLWVLYNASGTAGVWKNEGEISGAVNYLNGQTIPGSYRAFSFVNKTNGSSYWDQVAYRRSTDGGKTWTEDQMVLKPTEGTRDQLSVCDPGVVKSNNYYYIGYTSTENTKGIFNHAYIARSTSPAGPWEKWNGTGWGNNPQPIITFTGDPHAWGAGEPCMVVRNGTIFFYYSWNELHTIETHVATSDVNDVNWPAHLNYHGVAVNKTGIEGADHCDIKYRSDLQKFYAIHAASRLTPNSHVLLWESSDGFSFTKIAEIRENLKPYLHNCGWSANENGLIDPAKQQYLSYAYGPHWASWNTAWHPITFE